MQTFLPHPDFQRSARSLDRQRLGKQRVEALQILRAIQDPSYGWQNHPAVRMWRGYEEALALYGWTMCREWRERGYVDNTARKLLDEGGVPYRMEEGPDGEAWPVPEVGLEDVELPPWLGDESLHRSHRSRLVQKDPDHYGPLFPDAPADLDYVWPEPPP